MADRHGHEERDSLNQSARPSQHAESPSTPLNGNPHHEQTGASSSPGIPPKLHACPNVELFHRVCAYIKLDPSIGRQGEQRQSNIAKYTSNGGSRQPEWYSQEEKILAVLKLRVHECTNERIANLLGPVFDYAKLPRSFSTSAIEGKWSHMTGPKAKPEHGDILRWAEKIGPREVDDIRELVSMTLRIWDYRRRVDGGHGGGEPMLHGPESLQRNDSLAAHISQSAAGLSTTYTPSVAAEQFVSYRCTWCQHQFRQNVENRHRLDYWMCLECGGRTLAKLRIGGTIQYEAR